MGRKIGELPGGCLKAKKVKTVNGHKFEVRAKSYYGTLAGWNLFVDGKKIGFTNADFLLDDRDKPTRILDMLVELESWKYKRSC